MCFITLFFFSSLFLSFFQVLLQILPCFSLWTTPPPPRGRKWPEYISLIKTKPTDLAIEEVGNRFCANRKKNHGLFNLSYLRLSGRQTLAHLFLLRLLLV